MVPFKTVLLRELEKTKLTLVSMSKLDNSVKKVAKMFDYRCGVTSAIEKL